MKKLYLSLVLVLVMFLLVGNVSAQVVQKDIAFIVKNSGHLSNDEEVIKSTLLTESYTLDVFDDDMSFDIAEYKLIIVGEGIKDISLIFNNANKKTLFLSNVAAENGGLAIDQGQLGGTRFASIFKVNHEITQDFVLGDVTIYSTANDIYTVNSCFGQGAQNLVIRKGESSRSVLLALDKGSMLIDSGCTDRDIPLNEKNLFFGLTKASIWTNDGKTLFLNSVEWLIDAEENLAPVFDGPIDDVEWLENEQTTIELSDYFSDPNEDDVLIYGYAETSSQQEIMVNINNQTGRVVFSSEENWTGEDWIIFKATDESGLFEVSNNVTLRVLEVQEDNENPIVLNEEDLEANLKVNFGVYEFDLTDFESDDNDSGSDLFWEVVSVDGDFSAEISDVENDTLRLTSFPNEVCLVDCGVNLRLIDSQGAFDNAYFKVIIRDNSSPVLEEIDDVVTYSGETITLNPSYSDEDTALENLTLSFSSPLDGSSPGHWNKTGEYTWEVPENLGSFTVIATVSDPEGNYDSDDFNIIVNNPNVPVFGSLGDKTIVEGKILIFSVSASNHNGEDLNLSVSGLPNGATFVYNGDNSGSFSWSTDFEDGGNYDVTFRAEDDGGDFVEKTITLRVLEGVEAPDFSDADLCDSKDELLQIDIKDPDNNDDFKIGDDIPVEVDVRNNFNEDLEVKVDSHFYDLDEDESLDDVSDKMDVDKGDRETFEMNLGIPSDVEDDDFVVLIIARGEGKTESYCNYEYVGVNIEREDHDVIIDKISLSQDVVSPGENVNVEVKVKNIGDKDEDIYVELFNQELNVTLKSSVSELEKFGDDDDDRISLRVEIPSEAEQGAYDFRARVYFEDGDKNDEEHFVITIVSDTSENRINPLTEISQGIITLGKNMLGIEEGSSGVIILSSGNTGEKITVKDSRSVRQEDKSSLVKTIDEETKRIVLLIIALALLIGIILVIAGIVKVRG